MLNFLKPFECPVCGESYWRAKSAYGCCKGTPEYDAWKRQIDRRVAAAKAARHGGKGQTRVGLGLKDCPLCHGKAGNWNCRLCDGSGQVPENVL